MLRSGFFAAAGSLLLATPSAWAAQPLPPPPPPPPGYHQPVAPPAREPAPPKPPARPKPATPPKPQPVPAKPKAAPAKQQPPEWSEPPGTVFVPLESDQSGVHYQLFHPGSSHPVASCTGSCSLHIPPGRYRLHASRTSTTREGDVTVEIDGGSRLLVSPRGYASRNIALATAIAGMGLAFGGTALMASSSNSNVTVGRVGAALFLAGAVMTPVGWVVFAKTYHPSVRVLGLHRDDDAKTRLGIGPGGLSFVARF